MQTCFKLLKYDLLLFATHHWSPEPLQNVNTQSSFFLPLFFLTESCYGNSFSWITFSVSGLWPNLTLSMSSESGGHGGKLDLCVFSWLTGKNLSLPIPVEKERIVECRPWQSIPWVLMVGLSWTASSTADIYTQLTQVPERKTEKSERMRWGKKPRLAST